MRLFGLVIKMLSRFMYWISCVAIVSMAFLTVLDVILRKFGAPIDFSFEVVVLLAGVVIGFALPETSLRHGHVAVEYLETKLSKNWFRGVHVFTRCIGIAIFLIIGWNAIRLGNHLLEVKQVSPVLEIPEFPIAYGLGICAFIECLVLTHTISEHSEEKPS